MLERRRDDFQRLPMPNGEKPAIAAPSAKALAVEQGAQVVPVNENRTAS
jgi:hypothetical protein